MKVSASIYNLGSGSFNAFMDPISASGGVYHVGIEVGGVEWSYGYCEKGIGLFAVAPGGSSLGKFRESVSLGSTKLKVARIVEILHQMAPQWKGQDYSIGNKNCITFSKQFLSKLSPSLTLPAYAVRMSDIAESLVGTPGSSSSHSSPEALLNDVQDKLQMWKEAERIMRETEEEENGVTHNYTDRPSVIHSKFLQPPPPHKYYETIYICQKKFHVRESRISAYLAVPETRRLIRDQRYRLATA